MDILTADWETFYSPDYTLEKMTTESYIRDPRFEPIMCSFKWNSEETFWLLPDRADSYIRNEIDWSNVALLHHHAHFDGAIFNWHYGVRPAMFLDTLSMARVIHGAKSGLSLAKLLIKHGLREKGDYVTYAKGKHLADFTRDELIDYGRYCCNDTDGTYALANIFLPQLPEHELRLIDLCIRMFTEPVFVGDEALLAKAIVVEREKRVEMLKKLNLFCPKCAGAGTMQDLVVDNRSCDKCGGLGVDKKPIGSNEKFAALLRNLGVEPATKTSPTTGAQIYAFAKTDPEMQELLDDEDDDVRHLAETRIAVKSNIIESRATRFLHCAQRGAMPVYIAHAGAHTLRPSGGDSMNWLNMSNHNENRPEMAVLKQSIQAPPGHVVIAADSGQGEARIVAYLAGQQDIVNAFAQGRDVYSEHASIVYGRPVDRKKVKADYIPGQLGKISILGMGFGMGWYKAAMEVLKGMLGAPPIQFTEEHMNVLQVDPSRFLNSPRKLAAVDMMPSRLDMSDRLIHCIVADALVNRYRHKMDRIAGKDGFWNTCEHAITAMCEGREFVFGAGGLFRTAKDKVYTPNGLWLDYRDIRRNEDGDASYFNGRARTKIYGGLFTENLVQHMHRQVVALQMLEIAAAGLPVKLWTYDEAVVVVPEAVADDALAFMIQTMARTPEWAPGLPLTADGGYGKTYADAKPS